MDQRGRKLKVATALTLGLVAHSHAQIGDGTAAPPRHKIFVCRNTAFYRRRSALLPLRRMSGLFAYDFAHQRWILS
jgi:hypothetical protein